MGPIKKKFAYILDDNNADYCQSELTEEEKFRLDNLD